LTALSFCSSCGRRWARRGLVLAAHRRAGGKAGHACDLNSLTMADAACLQRTHLIALPSLRPPPPNPQKSTMHRTDRVPPNPDNSCAYDAIQDRRLKLRRSPTIETVRASLPSSSGPGRRPLTAKTGVRVPLGAPLMTKSYERICVSRAYAYGKIRKSRTRPAMNFGAQGG
jgi:hypothetical protein